MGCSPIDSSWSFFHRVRADRTINFDIRIVMEGKQLSTFVIALVSLLVTTIVIAVRCVVRMSIRGFGLDDWSMVIGQVCILSIE